MPISIIILQPMSTMEITIAPEMQPERLGLLNGEIFYQMYKLKRFPKMVEAVGFARTTKAFYNRVSGAKSEVAMPLPNIKDELAFPFWLTNTFSDIWSYVEINKNGAYDLPKELDRMVNGKPIIDIGAYIGSSATYLASRFLDSEVVAFEPHPRNYELLSLNAEPYDGRIQAVHAAVAARNTAITMIAHGSLQSDYMINAFVPDDDAATKTSESVVAVRTPEEILAMVDGTDEIGLIKVDIEGAEAILFESTAIDQLLQRTGILLAESHEFFAPGSERAIHDAGVRNGMQPIQFNSHTKMYTRS
jgi:FkbM family methyltransferase